MKKLMLIAVMAMFSSGLFAANTKVVNKAKVITETKVVKEDKNTIQTFIDAKSMKIVKKFPSGSGTITDACGNEIEVEWSCNYNCSGIAVINALIAWGDDYTDCGFSGYVAD